MSSGIGTTPSSLKVLVCSGNLGNAAPDLKSLEAWIPSDGNCSDVLEDQRYPLEKTRKPRTESMRNILANQNKREKFDLIVLGLQEATFDPPEKEKKNGNGNGTTTVAIDSSSSSSFQASKVAVPVQQAQQHKKKKKGPFKHAISLGRLMANRDHTDPHEIQEFIQCELAPNGTATLHALLEDRLPSYKRKLSFQRGEMRLMIYASEERDSNYDHRSIRIRSVRAHNTGMAGLPNKGGIVAEVVVDNDTTISFVTCHLEAHEGIEKYQRRCSTLGDIFQWTKQLAIPPIYPDVSLASHHCFVMGDLNFRTRYQGHIEAKDQRGDVIRLVQNQQWKELNEADELRKALDGHLCLGGFQTLPCNFPPTFKVERQTGYVYKDNRTPSYTDRICWKSGSLLQDNCWPLCYEPVDEFASSDHKPIRGAFEIALNQCYSLYPRETHHHRMASLARMSSHYLSPFRHHKPQIFKDLHLYLSDIRCDIFPKKQGETPPSVYLSVVTNPENILAEPRTLWQQCMGTLERMFCCLDPFDNNIVKPDWPSTPVKEDTFNPIWGEDEEIHCKLRAHHEDGSPIDLGGAILHIFAMSEGQIDDNIGSFPINLEYLYRMCLESSWRDNSGEMGQIDGFLEECGMSRHDTANNKMVSLDINGPLLKNGKHRGILHCSLDVWWVEDGIATAAKAESLVQGLASNDEELIRAARKRKSKNGFSSK